LLDWKSIPEQMIWVKRTGAPDALRMLMFAGALCELSDCAPKSSRAGEIASALGCFRD
jgi:hypothetical protein